MSTATKTRGRWRAFAVAVAATLAATAIPTPVQADDILVIDQGHVDAFNVVAENGGLTLDLKEDITGSHVRRAPDQVELNVKDAAFRTGLPESIPGSPEGYVLPLSQDHNLLWPGWDTLGIQNSGFEPGIRLHFTEVTGPGAIHLFSQGAFGGVEPLLEGGATQLTAGAVRNQSFPAHTHANWVFAQPGVYTITLYATGVKDGREVHSNAATYTFTVGDEFRGRGYEPVAEPEPDPVPDPEPEPDPVPDPEPEPDPVPDPEPEPDPAPDPDPLPDPAPQPDPSTDPAPQPSPSTDPTPDPDPSTDPAPAPACRP
ncbi:MAG: hypothetical protein GXX86_01330, partial [Propionibacterium sp.]|nr:hypothetical protein [Propionibacterium sp.]